MGEKSEGKAGEAMDGGVGIGGSSSSCERSPAGGIGDCAPRALFLKSLEPLDRERDRERRLDRPGGPGETVRSSISGSGSGSGVSWSSSGVLVGS
jgi:hypothetical protein